ncbi:MAG: UvrB/UvrC motif-containing protein [Clostridiales bacterium]|nr:UvrB/UvrC motif-containing protein [Clostridiales bacterium]
MLCQKCKKRPAIIHWVNINNGEKTEEHLCEVCGAEKGQNMLPPEIGLQKFFPFFAFGGHPAQSSPGRCPNCGWGLSELEQSGKLGCSQCYDYFRPYVRPVLERIHASGQHKGKIGARAGSAFAKAREIERLRALLADHVRGENFEEAARIRDQIRLMEGGKTDE